jgi:hypothetical protein
MSCCRKVVTRNELAQPSMNGFHESIDLLRMVYVVRANDADSRKLQGGILDSFDTIHYFGEGRLAAY